MYFERLQGLSLCPWGLIRIAVFLGSHTYRCVPSDPYEASVGDVPGAGGVPDLQPGLG